MNDLEQNTGSSFKVIRAIRLKKLRLLAKMSRRSFSCMSGIKESTLQNWEAPRHGGLTEQGAYKLVAVYKSLQIYFDIDWLMYGRGRSPVKHDMGMEKSSSKLRVSSVKDEIQFMKKLYPDAVIHRVVDDSMMPLIPKGTVVMGKRAISHQATVIHNHLSICLTESGEMLFRHVRATAEPDRFDLLILNSTTRSKQICLYSRRLSLLAPVFWFRYQTEMDIT